MKTSNLFVLCAILMTATIGCGLQEGDDTSPDCTSNCGDAGTPGDGGGPTDDGGTTTTPPTDGGGGSYIPAPVVSPAACILEFADDYISGSPCGDVVGTLPGMTWSSGPRISDSNSDGRLEYHPSSIPAGTYDLSYRDRGCTGEVDRTNWALYGDPDMLRAMSPDARSFIQCNWYVNGAIVQVNDPGCKLRINVGPACAITGGGNMRDFH